MILQSFLDKAKIAVMTDAYKRNMHQWQLATYAVINSIKMWKN